MSHPPEPTWYTLSDAASVLNVSPRTVERRIAAGELSCRKDSKGRRMVGILDGQLGPERQVVHAMTASAQAASDSAHVLAVALERANADLAWTRQQADQWQAEARANRRWAGVAALVACLTSSVTVALVVQGVVGVRQPSDGLSDRTAAVDPPVVQRRTSDVAVLDTPEWQPLPVDPFDDPVGRMMLAAGTTDCDPE
jgi:hypothetical protein